MTQVASFKANLLLHTDPRLLALSFTSALALLACFSWLEVSQVTLKTTKH